MVLRSPDTLEIRQEDAAPGMAGVLNANHAQRLLKTASVGAAAIEAHGVFGLGHTVHPAERQHTDILSGGVTG